MPRVLILTASMGEGHNTAAHNIQDALIAEAGDGVAVLVADPYTRTNPVINKFIQKGYATAINNYPRAWKVVFELLSRRGVVEGMGPMLAELTAGVKALIDEFQSGYHCLDLPRLLLPDGQDPQARFVHGHSLLHCDHRLHDDQFGLVSLSVRWLDSCR